jgi:predicted dehydrogenase
MASTVGVGVIGCGYWGPNLVRNFVEAAGSRVIAVSDLSPERLASIGRRYPAVETTTDYRDLLRDSRVDAVVVATPVATHFELALAALEAGKHVLVEKPLGASAAEAAGLVEAAARRRRVLMVDHTFVYTGAVRKIHELIAAGTLGDIYYYDSVRVNLGLFQHDVNVMWDLAVHDLSIIDYVLGARPEAVSAIGLSHFAGQPENIGYLTLFFAGSVIAHVHVNWLSPVKVRRTLIGGSRNMIVYDDLEPSEKIKVYDRGVSVNGTPESLYSLLVSYRSGDMLAPQLDITEALRTEAAHFVDCIVRGIRPVTDGAAGLRVVQILEAATQSMTQQGLPVALDLDRTPGGATV